MRRRSHRAAENAIREQAMCNARHAYVSRKMDGCGADRFPRRALPLSLSSTFAEKCLSGVHTADVILASQSAETSTLIHSEQNAVAVTIYAAVDLNITERPVLIKFVRARCEVPITEEKIERLKDQVWSPFEQRESFSGLNGMHDRSSRDLSCCEIVGYRQEDRACPRPLLPSSSSSSLSSWWR
ncbi:hypothetical protein ALC62_11782 [Cyphomyrmex costatus]|uniref:Uncharacterized protein n=1 Tax=Cyphomyrmex costatus TaxID=456900 RepID=A0A195C9V1_9HYME|nr:hypothetical protein ALC62_11782 [Cyphomyrmex costatus]